MKQLELRRLIRECINEINVETPGSLPIRIKSINKELVPNTDGYYYVQLIIDRINLDKKFKWYYFENTRINKASHTRIIGQFPTTNREYNDELLAEYKSAVTSLESQIRSIPRYNVIEIEYFDEPEMFEDFCISLDVPKELVKID
jgi:hypothetical protein